MKAATRLKGTSSEAMEQASGMERTLAEVRRFVEERRMRRKEDQGGFGEFERGLHARVMAFEREMVADEMRAADIDTEAVKVEGTIYRRVLRAEEEYLTAAGPVRVMRSLYKDHTDEGARAIVPLELRIGIVEGFWTPLAAQQGAWVVSQMVPKLGEELFERIGNMTPSKSSLDRLPKALSERWEPDRRHFEQALREGDLVPPEAVSVAVSLDGVLVPTKDGDGPAKRAQMAEEGRVLAANLRNRPGLRCDPRAHAGGRGWGTTRIGGRTSTRRARRSRAGVGCTAAVAGRSRRHSGRTPLTWRARTAWPRRHGRCASTRGSWRSSRRARRGAWSSLGVSWSSAALGSVSRARSRSSSWVGGGIACATRLSVARAARWSSSRWRARSGAAAHDGGDGADARAGVHRGGGLPQGHRRTGKGMSGGAVVGPVLGDALRVPKPPRHRHQAPGCPFGNSA